MAIILLDLTKHRKSNMEKESLIQFLQNTNLVPCQKATEISNHFIYREIGKNEFFLKEGKICNEYLFQVVFEVSSFLNRTISRENIQSLNDCTGWTITYEQLNMLFHTLSEFRDFGRHILVKGFASLKVRMLSMITETAEERYEMLIKSNPEIFQFAPLKYIASYLGVTDTSLSRIRKEFAKK